METALSVVALCLVLLLSLLI
jgi:hypothetical protein